MNTDRPRRVTPEHVKNKLRAAALEAVAEGRQHKRFKNEVLLSDDEKAKRNREHVKKWRADNKDRWRMNNRIVQANRLAARLKRTPPWADRPAIAMFYRDCPPGFHVDHVIPLRAERASGFHVVDNLQYLPAMENSVKRHIFEPYCTNQRQP